MTETTNQVYHGKYGYYPCSKEIFFKLKALNKALTKAKHQAAGWYRWARKAPKNRVIREYVRNEQRQKIGSKIISFMKEPEIDTFFCQKKEEDTRNYIPYLRYCGNRTAKTFWLNDERKPIKYIIKGYYEIPINADIYRYIPSVNGGKIQVDTFGVDRAYAKARKPKTTPEEVEELELSIERIEDMYKRYFD